MKPIRKLHPLPPPGMASFRATGWDPLLIIAQIIALQAVFYLIISLLLLIALTLTGSDFILDAIFDDTAIRTDTAFGWTLALVWLVNGLVTIPAVVLLIQRARLVLDFVVTMHGIHILLVWSHTGHFPTKLAWWVLQVVDAIVITLGGEWACMRYEMEPILLGGGKKQQQQQQQQQQGSSSEEDPLELDDEEQQQQQGMDAETWVHIKKRKTSDPVPKGSSNKRNDDGPAPLTRVMGQAKNVLLQATNKPKYEQIPMKDVHNEPSSSSSPSTRS